MLRRNPVHGKTPWISDLKHQREFYHESEWRVELKERLCGQFDFGQLLSRSKIKLTHDRRPRGVCGGRRSRLFTLAMPNIRGDGRIGCEAHFDMCRIGYIGLVVRGLKGACERKQTAICRQERERNTINRRRQSDYQYWRIFPQKFLQNRTISLDKHRNVHIMWPQVG
jgi:hypothetical protein